jgi:alcohol dehydrogenase
MDLLGHFDFALPTRIEYGPGLVSKLDGFWDELGIEKPVFITDAGIRRTGLLAGIEQGSGPGNRPLDIFDGISPNPRDTDVVQASEFLRDLEADGIIAVGGGSVLDCAKVASIIACQGGKPRDYEDRERIGPEVLPMIAVPTTAGSGSEVTFGAVITDEKEQYKFSVKSPRIAARIAVLDPMMTKSMPPGLTAATGMDALTHAIEAFTATSANALSNASALEAIRLISTHLVKAFLNGDDLEARAGMLLGSVLAGIAFSHSDVASVHCIAESMGGLYDAPHGACNAVVLPMMMDWNREACEEQYAAVAGAMGLSFETPQNGARQAVEFVRKLAGDVNLPGIEDMGLKKEDFSEIAKRSVKNGSNKSNPRPMAEEDYLQVLESLWEASN